MIKGWSDVVRFPRLGEIRLGEKDERGVPKALDYFVVPPEVQEVYGEQPRELDIMFPHEDPEVVIPAALKRYGDQWGLICRGDGEWATLSLLYARKSPGDYGLRHESGRIINADGEPVPVVPGEDGRGWVQIPCQYKACPHYQAQRCREVVLVNVLLPKVAGVLGVYTLATGSFHSYTNIKNALGMLRHMVGRISFVPLKLKVRLQEAHPEVNDKRIKRAVPVMYIDMEDMTLERMIQLARQNQLALVPQSSAPVPVEVEPADENSVPDLLYPALGRGEEPHNTVPAEVSPSGQQTGVPPEPDGQPPPGGPPRGGRASGRGRGRVARPEQPPQDGQAGAGAAAAPNTQSETEPTVGAAAIRRQASHLSPEGRLGVLQLVHQDPFLSRDVTPDEIVALWEGGTAQERVQVERALAVQLLLASVGDTAALEAELARRGLLQREEPNGPLDVLLYDSALSLADMREVLRTVRKATSSSAESTAHPPTQPTDGHGETSARAGRPAASDGSSSRQSSSTGGRERSGGQSTAGAQSSPARQAGGGGTPAAVQVTLQVTRQPAWQEQNGRRFVLTGAMVKEGGGVLTPMRTITVMAEGDAAQALAALRVGQVFPARVLPVSAGSVMVQEVLHHAAVAS